MRFPITTLTVRASQPSEADKSPPDRSRPYPGTPRGRSPPNRNAPPGDEDGHS
ncbi:hypothetical protein [Nonomuraea polychroma]|uniref:hypothetical protein n=1 Tax=Nonomuraea polychroma TaxID=46176 RepID=UPI0013E30EA2|nr:hypothetical protein [Nonomuraea polychroma]